MDIRKEESGKQMGKIETLSDYIGRCDDNMIDDEEKYNFIEEVMVSVRRRARRILYI